MRSAAGLFETECPNGTRVWSDKANLYDWYLAIAEMAAFPSVRCVFGNAATACH